MSIEIARDDLVRAMTECAKVSKTELATISGNLRDELVFFVRHDGISYTDRVPHSGGELGAVSLRPGPVADFVATRNDDFVDLSLSDDKTSLRVGCGSTAVGVFAVAPPLYSSVDEMMPPKIEQPVEVSSLDVFGGLYSASKAQSRPHLRSVVLDGDAAYTADGYRITSISTDRWPTRLAVPWYLATRGYQILRDDDLGEIILGLAGNACVMHHRCQAWTQMLPEIEAPDIADVASKMTAGEAREIKCDAPQLEDAIRTAISTAKDFKITLNISDGEITVSGADDEIGSTSALAECEHNGVQMSFALNGRYLLQALHGSDFISISRHRDGPAVIRSLSDDGDIVKTDIIMTMV
jgi:hypothetical protein